MFSLLDVGRLFIWLVILVFILAILWIIGLKLKEVV